ncbi:proteasome assembly chaperone 4 [Ptiloglossa arizonensis]|uniref:proteasome assembly chaperone 4 n=1 Tax=Ptiloglossa arizonensis TaxID=3350558 RepID=UPI003FA0ADB0
MEHLIEKQTKNECSFKFHDFVTQVGNLMLACHTIKMDNCLYLWVGDFNENVMNDLSFAIESPFAKDPLTTKIIGPIANEASSNLAKRLSKKLSKTVYVSFNVQVDNISLPLIERRLKEEFDAHPDIL